AVRTAILGQGALDGRHVGWGGRTRFLPMGASPLHGLEGRPGDPINAHIDDSVGPDGYHHALDVTGVLRRLIGLSLVGSAGTGSEHHGTDQRPSHESPPACE